MQDLEIASLYEFMSNQTYLNSSEKRFFLFGQNLVSRTDVDKKVYNGKSVPDGFFTPFRHKKPDMSAIHASASYKATLSDYITIRKICSSDLKIPDISPKKATEIL